MRILVIEDENELAKLMANNLRRDGFAVDIADCGAAVNDILAIQKYDVILLDLNLPDIDGIDLLKKLRDRKIASPIIIVSASSTLDNRVHGLNSGADDYIVKPFSHDELLARIRAILRRPGGPLSRQLKYGNLILDTTNREVFINDKSILFSRKEVSLLEMLMQRAGHVVSREKIESSLYSFSDEIGSNALDVIVSRLRKNLSQNNANISIKTIRGIGYILTEYED